MRFTACSLVVAVLMAGPALRLAQAEDSKAMYAASARDKFVNFPGLPTCMTGVVLDPSKGSSLILVKTAAGCVIPWHWHTPAKALMVVSGRGKGEMKDGSPVMLHAGDYLSLPSKGCSSVHLRHDLHLLPFERCGL